MLSKLSTSFKDRSDKYGGDEGENWEDIYTSYMSCAFEWGVSEDAALRNIENILAGEARTYYKRKLKSDPAKFKYCEDVNKFILDTFHGREAQEATVEYLNSLSLYNSANEKGSIVQGLKNVRDEIIKHINLVPKNLQTEEEQKRWLKYAVRSYRWARPTTARASELDFATMYANLRAQAIEEKRAADMKGRTTRGRIGDKTLGNVLFRDTYGNPRPNPKYRPFVDKNSSPKQFNGKCFGCGKYGYRRVDCPSCKENVAMRPTGRKLCRQ